MSDSSESYIRARTIFQEVDDRTFTRHKLRLTLQASLDQISGSGSDVETLLQVATEQNWIAEDPGTEWVYIRFSEAQKRTQEASTFLLNNLGPSAGEFLHGTSFLLSDLPRLFDRYARTRELELLGKLQERLIHQNF